MTEGGPCLATPGCTGIIEDGYCSLCGKIGTLRSADVVDTYDAAPATSSAAATNGATATRGTTGTTSTDGTSTTTGTTGTWTAGTEGHTRRSATATRRSSRSRIGAGLVSVPPMPTLDPGSAVMAEPVVAEEKRFCGKCGTEVGRGRDGRPGRLSGFCSKCRQRYSFVPPLGTDALVAGQYRIAGCLAYGGLGWIYLAQDEQVSNRWVVLKGLLNSGDADATAAAVAERQFLAQVEHPNVVRIYNFVQQDDAGYIVMEYVGGRPLKEVIRERRQGGVGEDGVLPIEQALAYILAILPAFSYLHRLNLLYNDFKPDNVMLQGDDVKLIDLGAVTHMDDPHAAIFGTDGYQAPEVARLGPSVASDLYSIARCLAMLVLDFRGYQSKYRYSLPSPTEYPILARYESLYRLLLKGTAENPDDRFQTADEMADQLLGVLREVVARKDGVPRPAPSALFGGDLQAIYATSATSSIAPDWRHLPVVKVNPADPASGFVINVAAISDPAEQLATLQRAVAQGQVPETAEAHLGQARALIWLGDGDRAERHLEEVSRKDPWDWRVTWYRGLHLLARNEAGGARQAFERIGFDLPGELAPKLAEGLAAELSGDLHRAAAMYDIVSIADPNFTSACFGLARVRAALGDRAGAVEAYRRVPEGSSLHLAARVALARALIRSTPSSAPGMPELLHAARTIERLRLEAEQRSELSIEFFDAALKLLASGAPPDRETSLLGRPFLESELRFGLEQAYRDLARHAVGSEKIRLVDRANQVRPMTAV